MKMKPKRFFWHIFPLTMFILVASLVCLSWYVSSELERFYLAQKKDDLLAAIRLIEPDITSFLARGDIGGLRDFPVHSARRAGIRITVISPQGIVMADSDEEAGFMQPHGGRPEVREALSGRVGSSVRFNATLHKRMLYVAVPLRRETARSAGGQAAGMVGVLRLSAPVSSMEAALQTFRKRLAAGGVVVLVLAGLAALWASSRISQPLEEMKESAERFARGDFSHRSFSHGSRMVSREVLALSRALNMMASELEQRFRAISRQGKELELVFSSMKEPVIVLDLDGRILRLNRAAEMLLDVEREKARGKYIHSIIRNPGLKRHIERVTETWEALEEEMVFHRLSEDFHLHVHFVPLRDERDTPVGILVVMNDITGLKRLEAVRRDFVANVSHELKTPITSIRGYAETLMEGALKDPEHAGAFLAVIVRQANRLQAITEDLLTLSSIEQDVRRGEIPLEQKDLIGVLEDARDACMPRAEEKNIAVRIECPDDLSAAVNPPLLEQAVTNLLINAIKYSHEESEVIISAKKHADDRGQAEVVISVQDFGQGISEEHLPRIFERFYRSDRARSRRLGGTGLGLAIVKHIALAHRGRVGVESRMGRGSIFYVYIPADPVSGSGDPGSEDKPL